MEPILKTKLYIPQARHERVIRTSLLGKIEAGARFPLLLVSAPAGFGKTALLAEWPTGLPARWPGSPWMPRITTRCASWRT